MRLYLASALQRVPAEKRWDAVTGLLARAEDRDRSQPAADGRGTPPSRWRRSTRQRALTHGGGLEAAAHVLVHGPAHRRAEDAGRAQVLAERLARTTDPEEQKELAAGIRQIVGAK